jgi:sec-independent protein translocase protein TatB
MFGIGMPELIIILIVALIVIGPKKLPDLAKSLGRALGEFKKATNDLKDSIYIDSEINDVKESIKNVTSDTPTSNSKTSALKKEAADTAVDQHDKTDQNDKKDDDQPGANPLDNVKAAFDEMNKKGDDSPADSSEAKTKSNS